MNIDAIGIPTQLVVITSTLAIFGVSLATVVGFFGRLWWTFDLFSHFRLQYLVLLTGLSVIAFSFGHVRVSMIGLLFALINFFTIAPFYIPQNRTNTKTKVFRIFLSNVLRPNKEYGKLRQVIQQTNPDIIILIEISELWMQGLSSVLENYPERSIAMRSDNYGMAIFSRIKIGASHTIYLSDAMVPSLVVHIDLDTHPVTLVATHPPPPKSRIEDTHRNQQLKNLIELINSQKKPILLLGDLNMTSWSPYFQELIKQSGLYDTRKGLGIQPTWPADKPIFMVPIDHILVSEGISIHKRFTGPYIGSDHRPVIVDFSLQSTHDY